jgi:acyl-CoA reductase-like NAD-dependent aldehyde dehydrogenase
MAHLRLCQPHRGTRSRHFPGHDFPGIQTAAALALQTPRAAIAPQAYRAQHAISFQGAHDGRVRPTLWFVDPTIFSGVNNRMRIARKEIFGPVLSVIPFADEEEAIAIANDTVYGLAAGVWTQSIRRALLMSERLRAGTVWVNPYRAVCFMSPFGGYKRSGLGRESGQEAIYEYPQQKSV